MSKTAKAPAGAMKNPFPKSDFNPAQMSPADIQSTMDMLHAASTLLKMAYGASALVYNLPAEADQQEAMHSYSQAFSVVLNHLKDAFFEYRCLLLQQASTDAD